MRGSIWPNFAGQAPGQILPGACPAKFGQIEPRLSGGPFKILKILKIFGNGFSKNFKDFKDFKGFKKALKPLKSLKF